MLQRRKKAYAGFRPIPACPQTVLDIFNLAIKNICGTRSALVLIRAFGLLIPTNSFNTFSQIEIPQNLLSRYCACGKVLRQSLNN